MPRQISTKIPSRVHFIGIDGISMSGLATVLQHRGHKISGSDIKKSNPTKKLIERGAEFFMGQEAENIVKTQPEMIVYTAAISNDNPELVAAKKSGALVIDRATLLGALTAEYQHSIAVAGTHGKTTTTSMLALALLRGSADPTALVGGELDAIGGNVCIGDSEVFLTEACEYVESFLKLHPYIAIILNIDADHLDYFRDMDHIVNSFRRFAQRIKPGGKLIISVEDDYSKQVAQSSEVEVITFGFSKVADFQAVDVTYLPGSTEFTALKHGKKITEVRLGVPGKHNVANALACLAACDVLDLNIKLVSKALEEFSGTHRRFEIKGQAKGALIVDDYAHHPSEIQATLGAARGYSPRKVFVAFQPHTYSRTKALLREFTKSFELADKVIITDIYAAREKDTYGISSKDLVKEMKSTHPDVSYASMEDAADILYAEAEEGDIIFSMGAGDIYKVADMILAKKGC